MYNKRLNVKNIKARKSNTRSASFDGFTNPTELVNEIVEYADASIADNTGFISGFVCDQNVLLQSTDVPYDKNIPFSRNLDDWYKNMAVVDPTYNDVVSAYYDGLTDGSIAEGNFTISCPIQSLEQDDTDQPESHMFWVDVNNKITFLTQAMNIDGVEITADRTVEMICMAFDNFSDDRKLYPFMCKITGQTPIYLFAKGFYDVYYPGYSAAKTYEGFLPLEMFLQNILSNMTSLTVLKQTAIECLGEQDFNISNLTDYVNAKTGSLTSTTGKIVSELAENWSLTTNKYNLLLWVKSKFESIAQMVAGVTTFHLTDNTSYITRSLLSGFISGLVSSIGSIVTVVGVAVGGIAGAVIAVAGVAINLISSAIDYVNSQPTLATIKPDYTGFVDCYAPWGFFQHLRIGTHNFAKTQETGASCQSSMLFRYFMTNAGGEMHLKSCVGSVSALSNIITLNGNDSFTIDLTKRDIFYSYLYNEISNTRPLHEFILYNSKEDIDFEVRWRTFCSLIWLMVGTFIADGPALGQNTITISGSTQYSMINSMYSIISQAIAGTINKSNANSLVTWAAFANKASGTIPAAIGTVVNAFTGHGWFQNTFKDSRGYSFSDMITRFYDFSTSVLQGGTEEYVIYVQPIKNIIPPYFQSETFWIDLSLLIGALIISATVTAVATFKIKRKLNRSMAIRRAKAESAWQRLQNEPTSENFKSYSKAARANNRMAKLCNGTVLNKTCYWDDSSDSSDGSLASTSLIGGLLKDYDEITADKFDTIKLLLDGHSFN